MVVKIEAEKRCCTKCGQTKLKDQFTRDPRVRSGRRSRCKECYRKANRLWHAKNRERNSENSRKWREKNPERYREISLRSCIKRLYGMTVEKYNSLLESQGGVCAICKDTCSSGRRLGVDHNHDTGEVRGLLCNNCNRTLGLLKDNPDIFLRAADYLQHGAKGKTA